MERSFRMTMQSTLIDRLRSKFIWRNGKKKKNGKIYTFSNYCIELIYIPQSFHGTAINMANSSFDITPPPTRTVRAYYAT